MSPAPGLEVRWAGPDELVEVGRLAARVFEPDVPLARSALPPTVADIASGRHPQTAPGDVAVALDHGELVGSAVLFEQPWRIGRAVFTAGRPELVVTHPDHRGRGVMRALLALLSDRSRQRGHPAECVTGVPYVYRRLGFDYTHRFGHGFTVPVRADLPGRPGRATTRAALRAATPADVPEVTALLGAPTTAVRTPVSQDYVRFGVEHQDPRSRRGVDTLVSELGGHLVAAVQLGRTAAPWATRVVTAALADEADPLGVLASLMVAAERTARSGLAPGAASLTLALGDRHVLYDAARACDLPLTPASLDDWYFRIADRVGFAEVLAGELTRRLSTSAFRHLSVVLRVDDHRGALDLHVEDGVVRATAADATTHENPLVLSVAPDRLASLLTGHRGVDDLVAASPETFGSPAALALARAMFPVLPAVTLPLD